MLNTSHRAALTNTPRSTTGYSSVTSGSCLSCLQLLGASDSFADTSRCLSDTVNLAKTGSLRDLHAFPLSNSWCVSKQHFLRFCSAVQLEGKCQGSRLYIALNLFTAATLYLPPAMTDQIPVSACLPFFRHVFSIDREVRRGLSGHGVSRMVKYTKSACEVTSLYAQSVYIAPLTPILSGGSSILIGSVALCCDVANDRLFTKYLGSPLGQVRLLEVTASSPYVELVSSRSASYLNASFDRRLRKMNQTGHRACVEVVKLASAIRLITMDRSTTNAPL